MIKNHLEELKNVKRCNACVLPSTFPGISFDDDGICNFCRDYKQTVPDLDKEQELERMFAKLKNKKGRYDCIVPISGGKDSTYVLYLVKMKYNLNPLTITVDNHFRSVQADRNLQRALKITDVDHQMITPRWSIMQKLYKRFLDNEGKGKFVSEFCIPCNIAIWTAVNQIGSLYGIPIIYGGIREIESSPAEIFGFSSQYFKNIALEVLTENEIHEFAPYPMDYKNASMDNELDSIWIFDYIYWDRIKEREAIRTLGWKKGRKNIGEIHIDCELHGLCNQFHKKSWGSIRTALHYSKMIRRGDMQRNEAIKLLEKEEIEDPTTILEYFRSRLAQF